MMDLGCRRHWSAICGRRALIVLVAKDKGLKRRNAVASAHKSRGGQLRGGLCAAEQLHLLCLSVG